MYDQCDQIGQLLDIWRLFTSHTEYNLKFETQIDRSSSNCSINYAKRYLLEKKLIIINQVKGADIDVLDELDFDPRRKLWKIRHTYVNLNSYLFWVASIQTDTVNMNFLAWQSRISQDLEIMLTLCSNKNNIVISLDCNLPCCTIATDMCTFFVQIKFGCALVM